MHRPRKNVVALLLGVVALTVVVLLAARWKDVYCLVFLDPKLVGRWETSPSEPFGLEFDRVGKVFTGTLQMTSGWWDICEDGGPEALMTSGWWDIWEDGGPEAQIEAFRDGLPVGTYRVDEGSLVIVPSGGPSQEEFRTAHRVEENSLTVGTGNNKTTYRRVPRRRPRE